MTLNTLPGIWAAPEGIEAKAGMERASVARLQFANSRGPALSQNSHSGPKDPGSRLG